MRFPGVMSEARYRELLECAPALTANDYERLANFWPMRPKLGQLVAIACLQIGREWATTSSGECQKLGCYTRPMTTGSVCV